MLNKIKNWSTYNYNLGYDLGASIASAVPLTPITSLCSFTRTLTYNKSVYDFVHYAMLPFASFIDFYIRRPAGNIMGCALMLLPFQALLPLTPQTYQAPTLNNKFLGTIITPGPVGRFIHKYTTMAVWGGIAGLVFGMPLIGASLGVTARASYENADTIKQALNAGWNFIKNIANQVTRFTTWVSEKVKSAFNFVRQGPRAIWEFIKDKTFGAVIRYHAAVNEAIRLEREITSKLNELCPNQDNRADILEIKKQAELYRRIINIDAKNEFLLGVLSKIKTELKAKQQDPERSSRLTLDDILASGPSFKPMHEQFESSHTHSSSSSSSSSYPGSSSSSSFSNRSRYAYNS